MSGVRVHRVQCAAITRGCMSAILWESPAADLDVAAERFLALNGWRLDHGRWICGNHPQVPAEVNR